MYTNDKKALACLTAAGAVKFVQVTKIPEINGRDRSASHYIAAGFRHMLEVVNVRVSATIRSIINIQQTTQRQYHTVLDL